MALTTNINSSKADQDEKLLLFNAINETNISSNALFCFICENWLASPICNKDIGVYMCSRCYDENDKNASGCHRKDLEAFLSICKFPCKYYNKGCPIMTSFAHIREHEENCNVITDMWKDFHCCSCEFKSPIANELIAHYIDVHEVPTITAQLGDFFHPNHFGSTNMLFVKMSPNLFLLKLSEDYKLQICHALGAMPQFKLLVSCCSESYNAMHLNVMSVNTNLNQLKWQEGATIHCKNTIIFIKSDTDYNYTCKYAPFGCLGHASDIICSYGLVQCGEQSLTFAEYCDYLKKNNKVIKNALIKRQLLDETKTQYITVDDNTFRLVNNTLDKLCWFGGNWKYSVYVFLGDVVKAIEILDLAEVHKLPEEWDMMYITRNY